jgi:hypothetical protein
MIIFILTDKNKAITDELAADVFKNAQTSSVEDGLLQLVRSLPANALKRLKG